MCCHHNVLMLSFKACLLLFVCVTPDNRVLIKAAAKPNGTWCRHMGQVSSTLACQEGSLCLLYSSQPTPGTPMALQQGDPPPMQLVATAAMLLLQVCVSKLHVHTCMYVYIYDLSLVPCMLQMASVPAVQCLFACKKLVV